MFLLLYISFTPLTTDTRNVQSNPTLCDVLPSIRHFRVLLAGMDQTAYLVSGFVGLIFTVILIAYVKFRWCHNPFIIFCTGQYSTLFVLTEQMISLHTSDNTKHWIIQSRQIVHCRNDKFCTPQITRNLWIIQSRQIVDCRNDKFCTPQITQNFG